MGGMDCLTSRGLGLPVFFSVFVIFVIFVSFVVIFRSPPKCEAKHFCRGPGVESRAGLETAV